MTNRVQTYRSRVARNRPPSGQPGNLYINFPDRQIGFIDPSNLVQDLVAVRFYSMATNYDAGDHVVYAGSIYICLAPAPAGPFDPSKWQGNVVGDYLPIAGGTLIGPLVGTSADFSDTIETGGGLLVTGKLVGGPAANYNIGVNAATEGAYIYLNAAETGHGSGLTLALAGRTRWGFGMDGSAETGANAGSGFTLGAYDDDGVTYLREALTINRADGVATFGSVVNAQDAISVRAPVNPNFTVADPDGTIRGYFYLESSDSSIRMTNMTGGGTAYITNNAEFVTSGPIRGGSDITTPGSLQGSYIHSTGQVVSDTNLISGSGIYPHYSGASDWIIGLQSGTMRYNQWTPSWYDGWDTNGGNRVWASPNGYMMQLDGSGNMTLVGNFSTSNSVLAGYLQSSGTAYVASTFTCNGGINSVGKYSRNGTAGTNGGNMYNMYWNGSNNHLYLDGSDWGIISTSCDYRMKKDVSPLGSMWAKVKALKPIRFTHQDWTPPGSDAAQRDAADGAPLVVGDEVERWGFLAHELQETLVESAASGVKDDPVAVQAPNPLTVIAALAKALQEAMTRIEALEAAGAR